MVNPKVDIGLEQLELAEPTASLSLIAQAKDGFNRIVHGDYSQKFRDDFRERYPFVTNDGVSLTARILNPEFLGNDEHAIVYNYSLLVPAGHGVELPTVADIAEHGERTGRAVVAITTDGHAGALGLKQLFGLKDFWEMPRRRFEFLRELVPPEKRLIATGSSLGGMMSHAMASIAPEEAEQSGHNLPITHVIAIASAGHHKYTAREMPSLALQFGYQEGSAGVRYVAEGDGCIEKAQRFFELLGTAPRHPAQLASVAFIGVGIMGAPLDGIENKIPHETSVTDVTLSRDKVTHPHLRGDNWENSGHPDINHIPELGEHLMLLTTGRRITLETLEGIPSNYTRRQLYAV